MIVTRGAAALAVGALLIAGCGSDGDSQSGAAPDRSATSAVDDTTAPSPEEAVTDTGAASTDEPDADQSAPPPDAAGGDATLLVDGEDLPVRQVLRCEPYVGPGSDANDQDLDIAVLLADGSYFNVLVSNSVGRGPKGEQFDQQRQELVLVRRGDSGQVQLDNFAANDVDGNWFLAEIPGLGAQEGSNPLTAAPFTITDSSVTGTISLTQSYPEEGTEVAEATFEVTIPSEIVDCSV